MVFFQWQRGNCYGRAESEGNKELGIDGVNPVFNLTRDVIQICNQIEYIILHKDKIEEWGRSSRIFVEKYHDSEMIAQQYINVFQKGLDCKIVINYFYDKHQSNSFS